MKQLSPGNNAQSLRIFFACLLAFNIFITPIAAIASSIKPKSEIRNQKSVSQDPTPKSAVADVFAKPVEESAKPLVPEPLPAPAPLPAAPPAGSVTASLTASLLTANGGVDADSDGKADPGDTIAYTLSLANSSGAGATGLAIANPLDPHTTIVGGSLNSTPVAFDQSVSLNEDATLVITLTGQDPDGSNVTFKQSNGTAFPSNPTTIATAHGTIGNFGSVSCDANGVCSQQVTYTPAANYNGLDSFAFRANDGTANSNEVGTASITVNPVNDAPTFTVPGNPTAVNEDAGVQTVSSFITGVRPAQVGNSTEDTQTVNFVVTNVTHSSLFTAGGQPALNVSNGGNQPFPLTATLTYTPAPDANGTSVVTYHLHDNGGTANSGVDNSADQTFTITVNAVNDAPVAQPKAFTVQANMKIVGLTGLLTGVTDPDATNGANDASSFDAQAGYTSPVATVTSVTLNTCTNGTISNLNANTGTFDFDPPPGLGGGSTCVLNYQVTDTKNPAPGAVSATQTITITAQGPVIWFVDPNRTNNGNGTLSNAADAAGQPGPFKSLSSANAKLATLATNQKVFIYTGTTASGVSEVLDLAANNDWLVGQGTVASSFDSFFGLTAGNAPPAGTVTRPTLNSNTTTANAARPTVSGTVTMRNNTQVTGVKIVVTGSNKGLTSAGFTSGTSLIKDVNVTSATGNAVDLSGTQTVTYETSDGTNSPNVLVSVGGIALNVFSGVTIGANGFTFLSISANGGTNGIVLNTTGATAGLTVTGTGTTAGSGGTIQNCTQKGADIRSAKNISLSNMNFTNNATANLGASGTCGDALNGTNGPTTCNANISLSSVTTATLTKISATGSKQIGIDVKGGSDLTLTNLTVTGNGNETMEDGVQITDLTGTLTVAGGLFKDNAANQFEVQNGVAGPLAVIVGTSTFSNTTFPTGATTPANTTSNSGLFLATHNSAVMNPTITNNIVDRIYAQGIRLDMAGASSMTANIGPASGAGNGNTITNSNQAISVTGSNTGGLTYNIRNNTANIVPANVAGGATNQIGVARSATAGTWTGVIDNNTVGTAGTANSGCQIAGCDGIDIVNNSAGTHKLSLINNKIHDTEGSGMVIIAGGAPDNSTVSWTVQNNQIDNPDQNAGQANPAILIQSGTSAGTDTSKTCLNISGNTITGTWSLGTGHLSSIRVRSLTTAAGSFAIVGFNPATEYPNDPTGVSGSTTGAVGNVGNVADYIRQQNPGVTNASPGQNAASATQGAAVFSNSGGCPLLLAEGGVMAALNAPSLISSVFFSSIDIAPSNAAAPITTANTVSASLTQPQLDTLVDAAIQRWTATGLSAEQIASLREIKFEVTDLTNAYLAESSGNRILVDRSAEGKGWFLDSTPQDDSEFANALAATRRYTDPHSAPAGHIDLLTAIQHEMGHKLGLGDSYLEKDRNDLMYGYLTVGERRLPEKGQAAQPTAGGSATSHYLALEPSRITIAFGEVLAGAVGAGTEVFGNAEALVDAEASVGGESEGANDHSQISQSVLNVARTNSGMSGLRNHAANKAVSANAAARALTTSALPPTPVGSFPINGTGAGQGFQLPDGKTITITFKATLNAPPNFASYSATQKVSAQATLTGSFVGNPLLSDDPSVVGATDPTSTSVDLYDSTVALTSSNNPSNVSQAVTFTATIGTSGTPNGSATTRTGTVTFKDGASPITCENPGGQTVNGSNVATCQISTLTNTSHTISADYSGDGNFDPSTGLLTGNPQVVNKSGTNATLVSSLNPSTVTQNVTFTFTISSATSVPGPPTGTVTFKDGASTIACSNAGGQVLNGSGVATCQTSTLTATNHTITADYPGDGNFNANNGVALTASGGQNGNPQVVNKATPNVTLVSSLNPAFVGQTVTFTGTVSAPGGISATPSGTLTFKDGGVAMTCTGGNQTLSGGVATCQKNNLSAGSHTITVDYPTDANFNAVSGTALTASGGQNGNPQVINQANTTMTVSSSLNPSKVSQSVKFTVNIISANLGTVPGPPTGQVKFWDGPANTGTQIGVTKTLASGGTCNANSACVDSDAITTLTAGTHTITVEYLGDSSFTANSANLSGGQVVNKSDTTTTITSNTPNPSNIGQQVTIVAHVTSSPVTFTNTGTVEFKDGASTISGCGTQSINGSGDATCLTTTLPAGLRSLTAVYSGDATFNTSTSGAVGQQVGPACSNSPVVMNTSDNGVGSLRQAIADACVGATITFDSGAFAAPGPYTINLIDAGGPGVGGQLAISQNLTITGPGASVLTVRRDAGATTKFRVFNITAGTVTISGMTISNGSQGAAAQAPGSPGAAGTSVFGGGISNAGTLNLQSVIVSGNSITAGDGGNGAGAGDAGGAGGAAYGGGIFNSGTLTLTNSTVNGSNSATGGKGGNSDTTPGPGGLAFGGGVYNTGSLTLTNSTVGSNTATGGAGGTNTGAGANGIAGEGSGGGIYNDASASAATTTITNSTISGNTAGTNGGGVLNVGTTGVGTLTISGSTFNGNSAVNGGGIHNSGTTTNAPMTITNSTFSGNSASSNGGGLYNDSGTSAVALTSVTITGNHADSDTNGTGGGGGIRSISSNIALNNSIVAGNFIGTGSGVKQKETITVSGTAVINSNILVRVTAAGMTNSPKDVSVAVANGDTAAIVAGNIQTALTADTDVGAFFDITTSTADVILTRKVPAANDTTMHVKIFGNVTGISNADSVHTTAGVAPVTGVQQVETATVVGTIAGINQVETATVSTNAGANTAVSPGGSLNVIVTANGMTGSPKTVPVTVNDGDDAAAVAADIRAALAADADVGAVTGFFNVSGSGTSVVLTAKAKAANDTSMNIEIVGCCTTVDAAAASADTTPGQAPGDGDALVTVTAAGMTGSPKTLNVPVVAGDSASVVAGKMRTALSGDADITNAVTGFTVSGSNDKIVLTKNVAAADDGTLNIATGNGTCTGLTSQPTSANTTAGVAPAAGTSQAETVTVSGAPVVNNGSIQVVVTAAGLSGSPRTVIVALTTAQTTNDLVADQIQTALQADGPINAFFTVTSPGPTVVLTTNTPAADDSTMHISIIGASGINSADSVHTTPGTSAETANDISGTLKTAGSASSYDLIGDAASSGGLTNGVDNNLVGVAVGTVLDPSLANNSGPTMTHKLVDNSPAIDKGNAFSLTTDQRGFQRPVDLDNGTYPNVSDASDIGAFERQTPPAQPTITLTSANTAGTTRDSTPDFSIGSLTVGATVELLRGGNPTSPPTTIVATAATMALTDNTLTTDGLYSYSARQTIGGDTATSTTTAVTVDTRPTVTALLAADDTGASNSDKITKNTTPRFTGTADNNTSILLFANGVQVGTGTSDGSGNWTITSSVLAPGTYSITAKEVIGGFTGAASSPLTGVVIDTSVAPPSTPDLITADDSGTLNNDNYTDKTTPTFTGTAEANSSIQLFANGNPVGTGSADGSGNWSVTSSVLSDGTYLMTAVATDLAGNVSGPSSGLSVTIDTQVAAPSMPDLISADDTGAFNNDNVTKKNTPTFTGTAEADSSVQLFADNGGGAVQVGTGTATGGNWSITSSLLADGTYQITAKATDTAGNVSSVSAALSVTIDTQVPAKPSTPDLVAADDTGASSVDNITKKTTPSFTGTSEINARVDLFKDSGGGPVASGTGNADGSGNWTILSGALADGTYQMTVVATDLAGNQSVSSDSLSVTIDTTPPPAPLALALLPADDTGTSNSDGITKKNTPTFTGTAETNSSVQLFAGATPVGSGTAPGGSFSIVSGVLPDNSYNMTAQATDLAGNTGPASSPAVPLTIDTVKPTVSMSSAAGNPTATALIPVTVQFSEPVFGFTISDIVPSNGTVGNFAGSNANYSFDLTATAAGGVSADIAADAATDTAGNGNTAAVQFNRTYDPSALSATITPISPNPRNAAVASIQIVFNKAVTGFDLSDLTLKLNNGANLLTGAQTLNSADNMNWTLGNLAGITTAEGTYDLKLTASGSGIQDSTSSPLTSDATASWVMDTTPPTVTVEQVGPDPVTGPTGTTTINFTATFSEPVTGLTPAGINIFGTANPTIVNVSGSGTTYNLAVQGMSQSGTVRASVKVSAATDSAGNGNSASTSVDNTVQFNKDNFSTLEVNSTADTDDGSCDPLGTGSGNQDCTLREAINAANGDFGAETITFNSTVFAAPGPYTINLTGALPDIATDMTISGPGAKVLTVKRNTGGSYTIFTIPSGNINVTINALTINNGSAVGSGGGIFNASTGTVNVTNSTISGNAAGADGGGIQNNTAAGTLNVTSSTISGNTAQTGGGISLTGGATVNITNSTISGNTATLSGGGINTAGALLTISNSTITNNRADNDNNGSGTGGGIFRGSGTVTLQNTLVAGNFNDASPSTTADDISGTMDASSSFNLIGTGGSGGLIDLSTDPTPAHQNQVGVANAGLNPLGDNGGPTLTHSLQCTSPAIDKGFKFTTGTDQRGGSRPFDFADAVYPNAAGGDGSDIGAVETQSAGGCVPTAVAASTSTNEDTPKLITLSGTYSQNIPLTFSITQNPAIGQLSAISNTQCTFNLSMSCTADVTYTPNANANGADLFKFKVSAGGLDSDPADVNVTVNSANDPPSFLQAGNQTVLEDAGPQSVVNFITTFSPGPPDESGQTVQFIVTNNTNAGLFSAVPAIDGTGTLTYTPAANANGSATITIVAKDNGGGTDTSAPQSFTITVLSVNDAPSFTKGADQTVLEDAGQQVVPNFATNISVGPPQESAQTAQFIITNNTNPGMFSEGPSITPAGTLLYVPGPDRNGSATITVVLKDNGGTLNGGTDTSAPQTFTINVTPVNDAPTLNPISNVVIDEDAPLQTVNLTGISAGGGETQTLSITATSSNPALIPNPTVSYTSPNATGSLTFQPLPDQNGAVTITVTLKDDGGTSNSGVDTVVRTFVVTVNPVNDAPINNVPGPQTMAENGTLVLSAGNGNQLSITDVDSSASQMKVTLTATNGLITLSTKTGLLFLVGDGTADPTMTFVGNLTDINNALQGLTFVPPNGFSGAASLQIITNDQNNTGPPGPLTDTDTISITVNDGGNLQFSASTYSAAENSGSAVITITRTGGSAGTATVQIATSNGTATAGSDYTAVSQTVTFGNGETSKTVNIPITDDFNNEPDETVNLTLSNVGGSGALGVPTTAVLTITNDDPTGGYIRFSAPAYSVQEAGIATITVQRVGTLTQAVSVDFATTDNSDPAAQVPCAPTPGNTLASSRCDFDSTFGRLTWAAGDGADKTFKVMTTQDNFVEGPETLTLTLSNLTAAASFSGPNTALLTITDDLVEPAANPIDDSDIFVEQLYRDFLNRPSDPSGKAFWVNNINHCNDPAQRPPGQTAAQCIQISRVVTAGAFFLSIEFQATGGTAYLTNKASFGSLPTFVRFERDAQQIGQGYVFGAPGAEALLESNKVAYFNDYVTRPEFVVTYGGVSNQQYVDTLISNTGVAFTNGERNQLVNGLNNQTETRATVLRKITEKPAFRTAETNSMFVLMEYFGFLRRNPDQAGFNFWLTKLNQFNGDYFAAEMVKAFIESGEYRQRFGQ